MISIVPVTGWDSGDSHDSNFDQAGMQNLIRRICSEVPGMDNPPTTMPIEMKILSEVLRERRIGVIFLQRGIHQAGELHYTISCVAAGGGSFHIYIVQGPVAKVSTLPLSQKFQNRRDGVAGMSAEVSLFAYVNAGVTYQLHPDAPILLWPALFRKENLYPGRRRGLSFCKGNSEPISSRPPTSGERSALVAAQKASSEKKT
jgi:hypothetical protein